MFRNVTCPGQNDPKVIDNIAGSVYKLLEIQKWTDKYPTDTCDHEARLVH